MRKKPEEKGRKGEKRREREKKFKMVVRLFKVVPYEYFNK